MADPTIQMFCCHHTNRSDMATVIMQEFNTNVYNSVCMLSSSMGILGALYQVLPREDSHLPHRWQSFSASRGKEIIIWLAVADLLASLGIFIRSALWMNFKSIMPMKDDTSSVLFCTLSSAWTQYFYMATWIWTLCYAIDMKLLLGERPGHPNCYHMCAWICPAILTTLGLTLLYVPDANCHNPTSFSTAIIRILPNYCVTYVLLTAVMIINPLLYLSSTRDLQTAVSCSLAQITGRERRLVHSIRCKFALTNLVYYVCWVPNLINGILLWTLWFQLPIKAIITLWYIMAVTNPLQAFFNAFVYKRSGRREKLRFEWCERFGNFNMNSILKRNNNIDLTESSPLLNPHYGCTPHTSINGSSSL